MQFLCEAFLVCKIKKLHIGGQGRHFWLTYPIKKVTMHNNSGEKKFLSAAICPHKKVPF